MTRLPLHLLAAAFACTFACAPALADKNHHRAPRYTPHHSQTIKIKDKNHGGRHEWRGGPRHERRFAPPPPPVWHRPRHERRFAPPPPPVWRPARHVEVREVIRYEPYYAAPVFGVREREIIREYYAPGILRGECPSGLYFQYGRCYYSGARRWTIGVPVPSEVIIEPLPVALVSALPPPPPRHRYVRVAGDILLLAIGTNMVVDALQDLFD